MTTCMFNYKTQQTPTVNPNERGTNSNATLTKITCYEAHQKFIIDCYRLILKIMGHRKCKLLLLVDLTELI